MATLGDNLDGKLDEVMVWGSDRSGSAKNDAETVINGISEVGIIFS